MHAELGVLVRASVTSNGDVQSAGRRAADRLAEQILAHEGPEEEWLLGSENDLMERLGIGRSTLRQAARLLEQQQLLVVRRGVGGGLFGRRPSENGVSAAARVFLRSHRTTFADLLHAELFLGPAAAGLAAVNPDDAQRALLRHHYDGHLDADAGISLDTFMTLAPRFQREVARLSRSPVLLLFVAVLMDLAGPATGIAQLYSDPERRRASVQGHLGVAQAIAEGNETLASRRMDRHLRTILDWSDGDALKRTLEPRR